MRFKTFQENIPKNPLAPAQSHPRRARRSVAQLYTALPGFRVSLATTTAIAALLAAHPALAAPTGGTVVGGSATISTAGATTNINQSTNSAIINWMGFSIASGETVNFFQPSPMSVTLNRVIGNEKSIISGALNANGQVFIVNSAGVIFTKGAQVNVGGIVASTQDISNQDFMAGNYAFSGTSQAAIINKGHINAAPGGYVALLGKTVKNDGVISAKLGTVALASGEQMTLNFGGNSLVDVTIDKGTYNALVANKGLIKADGGTVIMSAKAADAVLSAQVNNSGIIQARTIGALTGGGSGTGTVHVGTIKLLASGGTVKVAGRLDASAPKGGKGGTIETSGNTVKVASNAVITTKSSTGQNGNWIIDPDGFTIAATGGDITGAKLSSELASNNISILSTQGSGNNGANDGNLNVNDVVSWTSTNTLSLTATNAIYVNAAFTAPNGTLNLTAGTDINVNAPSSLQVAALTATAAGNVTIAAPQTWTNNGSWTFNGTNINVDDTVNWSKGTLTLNAGSDIYVNDVMNATNTAAFVGNYGTGTNADGSPQGLYMLQGTTNGVGNGTFTGQLNICTTCSLTLQGNVYQIFDSLTALINAVNNDALTNLNNNNYDQNSGIGIATGYYALGSNINVAQTDPLYAVSSTGSNQTTTNLITSQNYYGNDSLQQGVGYSVLPPMSGALDGLGHTINGLAIYDTIGNGNNALVTQVEPGGIVRNIGVTNVLINDTSGYTDGALVSINQGAIVNAFATGYNGIAINNFPTSGSSTQVAISCYGGCGGLVASDSQGFIANSYANVAVYSTTGVVGGFIGEEDKGVIINSYSLGPVSAGAAAFNSGGYTGSSDVGGFVGWNDGGTISNSYASGSVTTLNSAYIGGFAGLNSDSNSTHIGTLNNVSSSGAVNVNWTATAGPGYSAGGLVGEDDGGVVNNSASTSNITVTEGPGATFSGVGALVGQLNPNYGQGSVNNSNAYGMISDDLPHNGPPALIGASNPGTTVSANSTYTPGGTPPSTTQTVSQSNASQAVTNLNNARSNAQTLYNNATAQQNAVAQAAAQVAAQAAASAAAQAQLLRDAAAGADASMGVTGISAITPPDPEDATAAGKEQISALHGPNTDDNFSNPFSATTPVPVERRHAAATNTTPHRKTGGGGGAAIRSIEINGERFELEKTR